MSINVASLIHAGNDWLALMYVLIMTLPLSSLLILRLTYRNNEAKSVPKEKWRNLLFSLQGVALAFWFYDLTTTFYAINVTHMAYELNPLGWPLGILGALVYYAPTLLGSYVLLYRKKENFAIYAAMPITFVALGMSSQNLLAGAQTFQIFVDTTALTTGISNALLAVVGGACITVPLALKRIITRPKHIP